MHDHQEPQPVDGETALPSNGEKTQSVDKCRQVNLVVWAAGRIPTSVWGEDQDCTTGWLEDRLHHLPPAVCKLLLEIEHIVTTWKQGDRKEAAKLAAGYGLQLNWLDSDQGAKNVLYGRIVDSTAEVLRCVCTEAGCAVADHTLVSVADVVLQHHMPALATAA